MSDAVLRQRIDQLENLVRQALSRGSVPPTIVGTDANVSGDSLTFQLKARTVNAAAVTLDTGYEPTLNQAAKLDVGYEVKDIANNLAKAGNGNGSIKHLAVGAPVVAGVFGGNVGDAALNTAVPSFAVSGGNTLEVILTPPAAYVGDLDWLVNLTVSVN
jgi:hypothetical protein